MLICGLPVFVWVVLIILGFIFVRSIDFEEALRMRIIRPADRAPGGENKKKESR